MTGSCRSWIHYIELRSAHGTQKEHMDIAQACKTVFIEQFPIVSEALEWRNGVVEIQKQIKKELHGEETLTATYPVVNTKTGEQKEVVMSIMSGTSGKRIIPIGQGITQIHPQFHGRSWRVKINSPTNIQ